MNTRQFLGPIFLAFAGAYLAVGWFGVIGSMNPAQAMVIFGEVYVLLCIFLWDAKSADLEART